MQARRIFALAKKDWKRTIREPAVLFIIILFPVMLTVAFGASFGATAGAQPNTYSVAVVNLSQSDNSSSYSNQYIQALDASNVIKTHVYSSNETAQSSLSQGQVQAVLVIPETFDRSVQSYRANPNTPTEWINSSLSISVDRASLVSAQVIPSMVEQVLTSSMLNIETTSASSPIILTNPSLVQVSTQTVFDTFVPGLFAFASIFLIMMVAQSFTSDRESGMLRRIVATPTSASEIMTSQVVSYLLIGAVQAGLVLASAYALGYRPNAGLPEVVLGLIIASIFSICNVGFGLIAASIAKNAGGATGISFIFLLPQMFLGTYVGMALSSSAQAAGRFVPAFYVTDALNSLFTRGAAVASTVVLMDLGIVAASSIVILIGGVTLFRRVGRF
ncbi:MAG: ABC transporter permease [Nitrososphaerota archaeon]|nr:ABC transporter permease [Nitrososphaerota archaeon]MDG6923618.1 ABC transporter permease [Nitrososphaerota archaeon]